MSGVARDVLFVLLTSGPSSRAELAVSLELSKSTLTRVTRELVALGLISEGATTLRRSTGRPSELLLPAPGAAHFIGIKLTGESIYGVVTNLVGQIVDQWNSALTSQEPDAVVGLIAHISARFRKQWTVTGIGITLAGTVLDGGELILDSEYLHWDGVRLASLVTEATGLPVTAQNDVQALTAAEHWFGDGELLESLVVITVGAGVGCGIVANGRLLEGAGGIPGQVAHLPLDSSGPICRRGHRGCVEAFLSNDSIARAISAALGRAVDYDEAVELARGGDPIARRIFDDAGYALGRLIGIAAALVDPARVIVTGDGLAVWALAAESVNAGIEATVAGLSETIRVDSVPFEFTEWARAAAVLGIRTAVSSAMHLKPTRHDGARAFADNVI